MSSDRALSLAAARRFMVLHHLLAPPRSLPPGPASVMRVFDRLGSIQFDPLEIAGRNHDLVLLSRVAGYRRAMTDGLLYEDRQLFEAYNKGFSLLPTAELPWYRLTWDRNREEQERTTFVEHADLVAELLGRIERDGPLSATDIEPRAAIEWSWRPTNQVRAVLEGLAWSGLIGLRRRDGNRRVYDLAERLFPPELLAQRPSERDQLLHRLLSRYRAHGLLGATGSAELWYGTGPGGGPRTALRNELVESGRLVPVTIDGIRGQRYLITDELPLLDQAEAEIAAEERGAPVAPGGAPPGVAFLAALDPFVWDRRLLLPLYGFDYIWEVYVPAAKRRWGYYVLPILWGDRLVGRIEPRIERTTATLRVLGLWWEAGFEPLETPGFTDAFAAALVAHRDFAGLRTVALPRERAHRAVAAAVRGRVGRPPSPAVGRVRRAGVRRPAA